MQKEIFFLNFLLTCICFCSNKKKKPQIKKKDKSKNERAFRLESLAGANHLQIIRKTTFPLIFSTLERVKREVEKKIFYIWINRKTFKWT